MKKRVLSLRGSLADDVAKLILPSGPDRREFLIAYLKSIAPELVIYENDEMTVIGKYCEYGNFPPDW